MNLRSLPDPGEAPTTAAAAAAPAADGGQDAWPPVAALRERVLRGETRPRSWRLAQLERMEALLSEHEQEVFAALADDLGKPEAEAFFELAGLRQELALTRRNLRSWMRPQALGLPGWAQPGSAMVVSEPLGCVLIIGTWNYPLQLTLHPLISALAAGNLAVLKPSEHAPHTAALIARLVARHFPDGSVRVVQGDGSVAARLLEERFDHIFFTGGARVGRLVMQAAARHLTPVTLELGGKCPAVVLADADPVITARRLIWGRNLNAGQTCVAPDHVLVAAACRDALLAGLARERNRLYSEDPLRSPDLARIVDAAQFQRLEGLLAAAQRSGRVLLGGRCDPATLRIEPSVIAVEEPDDDPLMQEELFGPLLPLIVVDGLEAALERIRRGPRSLAVYLFSESRAARDRVLAGSSSGCLGWNDVIIQAGVAALPFGGVGESGMGAYHGEAGFRTFSHRRSVVSRALWPDLPFRYPPYAGKLGLFRRLMG